MAAAGQSAQAPEIGLERRAVGLPTAIGTTFSLIVASSVLATVAGGFFASWVWLLDDLRGHELLGARDDDP
jgi:hypothetical protein